jgi:hypothetical protein
MLSRHEREKMERLGAELKEVTARADSISEQVSSLVAQREAYERALLIAEDKYDRLLASHQELIKSFQKVADQYTDGLTRARATINELSATTQQLSQPFRNTPLHKTEEEEDLEFQLDHGVLSMTEYNEALRAAGLADD